MQRWQCKSAPVVIDLIAKTTEETISQIATDREIPLKLPPGENEEGKVQRLHQAVRITATSIQSIAYQQQVSLFLLALATENIRQDRLLGIIEGVDKQKLMYRLKAGNRWSRLVDEFSIEGSGINIRGLSGGEGDKDQPKTPASGEGNGNMQDSPPNREGNEILDNDSGGDNENQLRPPAHRDSNMNQPKTSAGGESNGNMQDNPPSSEGNETPDNYSRGDNRNQLKCATGRDGDMDQPKTPTGGEGNRNMQESAPSREGNTIPDNCKGGIKENQMKSPTSRDI
ncbi:hypothetical protein HOY80DRAFT_1094129 [Tuber brumale]|nr:hypothetical protein HOY80DRAFT_1094129 [Tuber brumale]